MNHYALIDRVLDAVQLEAPIGLEDVAAVRAAIGDGPGLEVYHRVRDLVVEVRSGHRVVYRRVVPVSGEIETRK